VDDGGPITCERWISLNYFGNPPAVLSADEEAEVPWWLPSETATRSRCRQRMISASLRGEARYFVGIHPLASRCNSANWAGVSSASTFACTGLG
jgi:hypothetical protein